MQKQAAAGTAGEAEVWLRRCREALALDPAAGEDLETLVATLHERVFVTDGAHELPSPPWLESLRGALRSELAQFEELQAQRQARLRALVRQQPVPALVISDQGAVLAVNDAAGDAWRLLAGEGVSAGLGLTRPCLQAFQQRCADSPDGVSLLMAPLEGAPVLFAGSALKGQAAWLLVAAQWTVPPGLADSLCAVFALSARECEVLAALCRGLSSADIAAEHGRSHGTVRQQIKAVLQKLGVGSQAQAIALVAAASASYRQLQGMTAALPNDPPLSHDTFRTPAGRLMGWREYGDPHGQPVLFLHGALFGAGELKAERLAAQQGGVRVIAPERPGYGHSGGVGFEQLLPTSVDDILALLDVLGLTQLPVLAHDVGTALAFHLAAWAPQRVSAILAAPATPPMRDWGQTAVMPPAHRIHAWTAQRAPWLMDTLISVGLAQVRRQGYVAMPDLIFGGCAFDRNAWLHQARLPAAAGAYSLIGAQQAHGFKQDMRLTNVDWSTLARQVMVPVRLFHGAHSQTVNGDALRAFADSLPDARLEIVPDAGHTLPLTHPELLLTRMAALCH